MLKRINLDIEQKKILQEITGQEIFLKNINQQNTQAIAGLMEQAKLNAEIYLSRQKLNENLNIFEENNLFAAVVDLQKQLGLKFLPRHIECYDISHLSGKFTFGSMVTFVDGRAQPKLYKLFRAKDGNNDFENHRQVLTRRLQRALDWQITNKLNSQDKKVNPWQLPNLIIVDGGKGQLSSDYEVLIEFEQKFKSNGFDFNLEICSLAKRQEEIFLPIMSKYKDYQPGLLVKELNLPLSTSFGDQGGILLTGQTKFLVQRIRDEAHRFAITNNRNARIKEAKKSQLDQIKGIGEGTKKKLLSTFGSVQNLAEQLNTNRELVYELIGKNRTEILLNFFNTQAPEKNVEASYN